MFNSEATTGKMYLNTALYSRITSNLVRCHQRTRLQRGLDRTPKHKQIADLNFPTRIQEERRNEKCGSPPDR